MRDSLETPQDFWLPSDLQSALRREVHLECAPRLSLFPAFADGVVYLRDVCLTLAAFVAAAPAAAHALVAGAAVTSAASSGVSSPGSGGGGLLAALQSVHDELAPALAAAVRRPKTPTQPATQVLHAAAVPYRCRPGSLLWLQLLCAGLQACAVVRRHGLWCMIPEVALEH